MQKYKRSILILSWRTKFPLLLLLILLKVSTITFPLVFFCIELNKRSLQDVRNIKYLSKIQLSFNQFTTTCLTFVPYVQFITNPQTYTWKFPFEFLSFFQLFFHFYKRGRRMVMYKCMQKMSSGDFAKHKTTQKRVYTKCSSKPNTNTQACIQVKSCYFPKK